MPRTILHRNIQTPTHGHVEILPASSREPKGVIVAFHGYAQSSAWMREALEGLGAHTCQSAPSPSIFGVDARGA